MEVYLLGLLRMVLELSWGTLPFSPSDNSQNNAYHRSLLEPSTFCDEPSDIYALSISTGSFSERFFTHEDALLLLTVAS